MTLVDVLYEQRTRLLASADGAPADLFAHVVTQVVFRGGGGIGIYQHQLFFLDCAPADLFAHVVTQMEFAAHRVYA